MCVIAIKQKGYDLNEKYIRNSFSNNEDGSGFMYAVNGKVKIEKGFFKVDELINRLKEVDRLHNLKDKNLVMHFRIATSGNIDKATCHPFPISNKLKDLRCEAITTNVGIVHNGVVSKYNHETKMSDTQRFILNDVSRLFKLNNKKLIKEFKGNGKFCILKGDGTFKTFGDFIEEEGYIFSNASYSYNYYDYITSYKTTGAYGTYGTYSDYNEYFLKYCSESEPLSADEFVEKLKNLYVLHGYVELDNFMYLEAYGDYAMDIYGCLYRINHKEHRITDTCEEVIDVYAY